MKGKSLHLVRKPESWHAIILDENTTQADLTELYRAERPDGTATVSLFKFGTPARFVIDVVEQDGTVFSQQFQSGALVYYAGTSFAELSPPEDFVPYEDVYGPRA